MEPRHEWEIATINGASLGCALGNAEGRVVPLAPCRHTAGEAWRMKPSRRRQAWHTRAASARVLCVWRGIEVGAHQRLPFSDLTYRTVRAQLAVCAVTGGFAGACRAVVSHLRPLASTLFDRVAVGQCTLYATTPSARCQWDVVVRCDRLLG